MLMQASPCACSLVQQVSGKLEAPAIIYLSLRGGWTDTPLLVAWNSMKHTLLTVAGEFRHLL